MTKVIIIGEKPKEETKGNIVFDKYLDARLKWTDNEDPDKPSYFNIIELVCLDYALGHDLMFAYDDDDERADGTFYIGHFNDGVV